MANFYTSTEILNACYSGTSLNGFSSDTEILNAVFDSTQNALRISGGSTTGSTYDDTEIRSELSTEVLNRTLGDGSLQSLLLNETTSREISDASLSEAILNLTGITYDDTLIRLDLTNETLARTLADESISSALSTVVSLNSYDDTSLSTALSDEIVSRTLVDTSLSTAVSTLSDATEIGIETILSDGQLLGMSGITLTGVTNIMPSLSTSLVGESSTRLSVDESLSTSISVISGSSSSYDDSSLSTAIENKVEKGIAGTTTNMGIIQSGTMLDVYVEYNEGVDYAGMTILQEQVSLYCNSGENYGGITINPMTTSALKPIIYNEDFSGSYDDRTLIDKGYLTSQLSGISGGTYDDSSLSTAIDGKVDKITNASTNGTVTTIVTDEKFDVESRLADGSVFAKITLDSNLNTLKLTSGDDMMMSSNDVIIGQYDTTLNSVIKYTIDHSSNYDDRTLIDKGYLDTQISGLTSYDDTVLSTAISTEVSDRTEADLSLSTSIDGKVNKITNASLNGTLTTIVTDEKFEAESRTNDGMGFVKVVLDSFNGGNGIGTITLTSGDDMMGALNNVVIGQTETQFNNVIKYTSDIEGQFDDLSLVTKGYVSTSISGFTSVDESLSTALSTTQSTMSTYGTIVTYGIWVGTQAEYDALGTWGDTTLYYITA